MHWPRSRKYSTNSILKINQSHNKNTRKDIISRIVRQFESTDATHQYQFCKQFSRIAAYNYVVLLKCIQHSIIIIIHFLFVYLTRFLLPHDLSLTNSENFILDLFNRILHLCKFHSHVEK